MSDSLWPHTPVLCPWNSPDKNTGMGSHSLLQVIFQTQGSNPGLLPCRQILYHLSHQGSPKGWRLEGKLEKENQKERELIWWEVPKRKLGKNKSREQQVSILFPYRKDLRNKFLLTWVMYKQVISFSFRGSWLETGLLWCRITKWWYLLRRTRRF